MNQDIFVIIEHIRGQVSDISYVMLAAARDLADATSGSVVGVLLGSDSVNLANNLAADRVLYGDDPGELGDVGVITHGRGPRRGCR